MKYKIIDDSDKAYIVVKCPVLKENITIHPAVRDKSKIGKDYLIAPDDHRYVKEHIHAIRCRCKKCSGLMTDFLNTVKESGATIIDGKDKEAIKKAFISLKK